MTIMNLYLSFILPYQRTKVSHNIIDILESKIKSQQSPLIGKITNHSEMVEPDKYIIVYKSRENDASWL